MHQALCHDIEKDRDIGPAFKAKFEHGECCNTIESYAANNQSQQWYKNRPPLLSLHYFCMVINNTILTDKSDLQTSKLFFLLFFFYSQATFPNGVIFSVDDRRTTQKRRRPTEDNISPYKKTAFQVLKYLLYSSSFSITMPFTCLC